MRIDSLHIENFRGIDGTYNLEVDGESRVIVGPNGSGKSSILGAVDYLLSGSVTHLSGEGMGKKKREDVVSNVNTQGECLVRGTFSDSDTGESVQIERNGESGDLTPSVDEIPSELQQLFSTAKQGQHILTRDDILDLIITRPGKRREVLQSMLDLPELDEQRLALKRTKRNLENKQEKSEASAESTLKRVRDMADSRRNNPETIKNDVLGEINELRADFGGEDISSIEPEMAREGLESPAAAVAEDALQREQPIKTLDELEVWTEKLEQNTISEFEVMADILQSIDSQDHTSLDLRRLELLEVGERIIPDDADSCPLCNQEWIDSTPLHEDIRKRRQELEDVRQKREEFTTLQDKLETELQEGKNHIDYLTRELNPERHEEARDLSEFNDLLNQSLEHISKLDLSSTCEDLEALPILKGGVRHGVNLDINRLEAAIAELKRIQEGLPVLGERERKYELINSLAAEWKEYQTLSRRTDELDRLRENIDTAEEGFINARKDIIGQIYTDIADTIQDYYGRIHPDEEAGDTSIEVTETGAEIQQQFYDAGEYPPQLVQSEGHLDTLGLSMYLALSRYLQQGAESLLLLDDVVMSVDNEHRREVAQLLADEVADQYQLFIATHDELWAEQLRSHGALHGGSSVKLREWSPDAGIVEKKDRIDIEEQWEVAIEAMEEGETERAAHEMRYSVERMLQQTCIALGAKVEYKPKQNYTIRDFKDAVSGRVGKLSRNAKQELDGYEHHENRQEREKFYKEADQLNNEYGTVLDEVGQTLQRVNRRVHWSPGKWLTLGPEEFEEVYETHRRAYDLLYCDDCGSSIQHRKYEGEGQKVEELRCNCGSHCYIRW